jgi:hypothetical protein
MVPKISVDKSKTEGEKGEIFSTSSLMNGTRRAGTPCSTISTF